MLKPRNTSRKDKIPEKEIFREIGRIWKLVGQRPSKNEWEQSEPKFSYGCIYKRFNGWLNACAAYIEYVSKVGEIENSQKKDPVKKTIASDIPAENKREIPLKLRYEILKRDSYKCVHCGNSPALNTETVLHVDHITPYSKAGKTEKNNLQTLCNKCNWGKGNEN